MRRFDDGYVTMRAKSRSGQWPKIRGLVQLHTQKTEFEEVDDCGWAEWLTVGWSKIPLARDAFLLLMTRTMNESMVGKAGRMIQKKKKEKARVGDGRGILLALDFTSGNETGEVKDHA